MKKFFDGEIWSWIRTALEIFAFVMFILCCVWLLQDLGIAEDAGGTECWVICDPDSYVTIREKPRKSSLECGGAMCGSRMMTDGKVKNGFLHVYDLSAESDSGWISTGFVVYDPPEEIRERAMVVSPTRLAARKWIGGKIKKWLANGTRVTIICRSDEWSLTNCGYVKTEFLELCGDWDE